jgi:antitoxin FitA
MPSAMTIRQIDDDVYQRLREQAARHGRSMEAEARQILAAAVAPVSAQPSSWWDGLEERAAARSNGRILSDSTEIIRQMRDERG